VAAPPGLYCDLVVDGDGLGEFEGMAVDLQNQVTSYHRMAWGRTTIAGGKFSMNLPSGGRDGRRLRVARLRRHR
jgi:hypothetical protein